MHIPPTDSSSLESTPELEETWATPTRNMKVTDANLERHIRLLMDAWFVLPGVAANPEETDLDAFLNCVGLVNATAECTRSYLDTLPENRMAKGVLARSIFEFGITCVWLSLRGAEGFEALRWEDQRQQKNTAAEMTGTSVSEGLRTTLDRIGTEPERPRNHLAIEARRFDKMVSALDSGDTPMYVIYRMYSQYSHGSLAVSNSYLDRDEDGDIGVYFPARHPALNDHLGTAVAPLVWAMNAVNKVLVGQPLTKKLTFMQTLLGTGIDFTLREPPSPAPPTQC